MQQPSADATNGKDVSVVVAPAAEAADRKADGLVAVALLHADGVVAVAPSADGKDGKADGVVAVASAAGCYQWQS